DTINYTIYYGRPGTATLSNIVIFDTQPPNTHYVPGSGVPAPDPAWSPDPGPPLRLQWTVTSAGTAGGPTGEVRFQLTVDWGNGESFEPGSGDTAAPEGARLTNRSSVSFPGSSCPIPNVVTLPTDVTVRRFLFWKLGSNDMLFSASPGQPPDEMTYEIFLRNESATKTWWNVRIWDTVPTQVTSWCVGCGFEDPCVGWTMTPTGCAA
ncbi:MAG: hypothetical protein AAB368_05185, partial [bacterium]